MKVLLLGCGEMGEEALKDLAEYGGFDEIKVGTRTPSRADAAVRKLRVNGVKISLHECDVSDIDSVSRLMAGCAVAINCAGPNYKYEIPVALAAINSGTNLVDINDEYEITSKMYEMDDLAKRANILIVMGLGGCPGIDNVLVRSASRQLDEVEEIHTAWVMSGADPGGLALSYHLLYSLSDKAFTVHEGKMIEVNSFRDGKEKMTFPDPVGKVNVYHIGHPEPITLFHTFPNARVVDNKATFVPEDINELIRRLGKVVRGEDPPFMADGVMVDSMDTAAHYLHAACKNMKGVPPEAALRVEVAGTKRGKHRRIVFSSVGMLARATGIPASIGATMIARNRVMVKGVRPPEACIEPNDFLYEMLDRRNVARLNGWIED